MLKIVKEMNLQQVQVTEQKVRIETLQKDAVDRQLIIKKMYQRNANLVTIAEALRGRYSALKRDRGSNIEEMKEAAVFTADIDLMKHRSKLEMTAEADDAKKWRTLDAKSRHVQEISGGALRIGPGGDFNGRLMGMNPVSCHTYLLHK